MGFINQLINNLDGSAAYGMCGLDGTQDISENMMQAAQLFGAFALGFITNACLEYMSTKQEQEPEVKVVEVEKIKYVEKPQKSWNFPKIDIVFHSQKPLFNHHFWDLDLCSFSRDCLQIHFTKNGSNLFPL